ncbi:hypothetical protein GY45DRAFT_372480 [Cubamyces sp. BRFM 1775]|nr:hypothetical protein GY45DRAFT_372480 [Cubamyces sp. BRFM 1775]
MSDGILPARIKGLFVPLRSTHAREFAGMLLERIRVLFGTLSLLCVPACMASTPTVLVSCPTGRAIEHRSDGLELAEYSGTHTVVPLVPTTALRMCIPWASYGGLAGMVPSVCIIYRSSGQPKVMHHPVPIAEERSAD